MDNFDVYEWNKKRYLKRIEESDDPKLGGELEAGVKGDRVEEGPGKRQATMKLDQLTFNVVKGMFGEIPMFGIAFPNADDSYRSVFNGNDLEDWKAGIRKRYGNVNIRIDVEAASPWERIQILDDKFRKDKKGYIAGKAAWLDKERQAGRSSGLDENLNEAYEPKHFDICPGAQALRDRVVDGEFGSIEEFDLDKWTKLHDALFGLEKKVLRDKEAEDSDVNLAEKLRSEIINLSRDINIPSEAIGYLKGHVDKIRDISDYSALTEKEDDKFAGSDPKAGSTIQGTGFNWKPKAKK